MEAPTCRFCFDVEEPLNLLITPCDCEGSIKFVHSKCLLKWQSMAPPQFINKCQLCLTYFRNYGILLEIIPHEKGILYQFLICPYLFTFTIKYILFMFTGMFSTSYTYTSRFYTAGFKLWASYPGRT
ncbi:MAG: E3 ubiquitin-protein ligase MARCH [Flavobacteriia bacterium]|nr:E3 ubiquitin-protein ligase MARCH [Flavobacteriia bacterium]